MYFERGKGNRKCEREGRWEVRMLICLLEEVLWELGWDVKSWDLLGFVMVMKGGRGGGEGEDDDMWEEGVGRGGIVLVVDGWLVGHLEWKFVLRYIIYIYIYIYIMMRVSTT